VLLRCRHLAILIFTALPGLAAAQLNGGWLSGVTAKASSEQVPGYTTASRVTNDDGLSETAPGSGLFQLSTGEVAWTTQKPDEQGAVEFDLGSVQTVNRFRVWNGNGPGYTFRGFREVTFQWSNDALLWSTSPQKITLNEAPAQNSYTGQEVTLTWPVTARYLRLWCDSTHRTGGDAEQCELGKVRFYAGGTPASPPAADGIFPSTAKIINVRSAPYFAAGDGSQDDYAAIQQAIYDNQDKLSTLYFPAGTYRLSQGLRLRRNGENGQHNGYLAFRGDSAEASILKLDNNVLTNPASPVALLDVGFFQNNSGNTAADWFQINLNQLTIHTGSGNPGAIGLRFYSNNVGVARDLKITSGDGQGVCGLDCVYASGNGPNLVKNVRIEGYGKGIHTGNIINSQVFENITLVNQSQIGWLNESQILSIRNLSTTGSVPPFRSSSYFAINYPHVTLIDAVFTGSGAAGGTAAVENSGSLLARNVKAPGFATTIRSLGDFPGSPPPAELTGEVVEYSSSSPLQLFSGSQKTLNLPAPETPVPLADAPETWANVRNYRQTTELDIGPALQRAIDSGAGTVFLPAGSYSLRSNVQLRNNIKRLSCFFSTLNKDDENAALELAAGNTSVVSIEDIRSTSDNGITLRSNAPRSLVVRNAQDCAFSAERAGAKLYLENCAAKTLTLSSGSSVWASQLNLETSRGASTTITNNSGRLCVLGYKTEGVSTICTANAGSSTEILGGLAYSGNVGNNPMFVVNDSEATFSMQEVKDNQAPFPVVVRETRNGQTRDLLNSQVPQFNGGSRVGLFSSAPASKAPKVVMYREQVNYYSGMFAFNGSSWDATAFSSNGAVVGSGWGLNNTQEKVWFADIDGDGTDEMYREQANIYSGLFKTTGAGWTAVNASGNGTVIGNSGWGLNTFNERIWFGDFDGDGDDDMYREKGNASAVFAYGASGWEILSSRADGSVTGGSGWGMNPGNENVWFADFDGDGRTDMYREQANYYSATFHLNAGGWTMVNAKVGGAVVGNSGWGMSAGNESVQFVDMNGDGALEMYREQSNIYSGLFEYNSNGWNYLTASGGNNVVGSGWGLNRFNEKVWFGDFDGNGRADMHREQANIYSGVFKGSLAGWDLLNYNANGSLVGGSGWGLNSSYEDVWINDFDGNGLTDMYREQSNYWAGSFRYANAAWTIVAASANYAVLGSGWGINRGNEQVYFVKVRR
jgi:Pectate lyase superfamily protein/F5/8 type C domain